MMNSWASLITMRATRSPFYNAESGEVRRTALHFAIEFAISNVAFLGAKTEKSHTGIARSWNSRERLNQSL